LVLGLARPLTERTEPNGCAACGRVGTVCFSTFPLNQPLPVEMDLCPEHLRRLLGRRLGPGAFNQVRRQLRVLGLSAEEVFLLHRASSHPKAAPLPPPEEPKKPPPGRAPWPARVVSAGRQPPPSLCSLARH